MQVRNNTQAPIMLNARTNAGKVTKFVTETGVEITKPETPQTVLIAIPAEATVEIDDKLWIQATSGKTTVREMKEVTEVEEGKRCDCCGQLITTPLWDMPYGSLCDECNKRLTEQVYGKYKTPWQKVEQGIEERSTPWWFDL